ncbi:MAG TPA: TA system VapC family ribonuclease toxin [Thermoanaerobaculia bacterium]|nr:TA system VapC family ribonuclease toxin [Thermoanaerobaculia bacterium]
MSVVDTNVLVYAANSSYRHEHGPCRSLLQRLGVSPTAWFLTWPILYEFLRVTTHPRVLEKPLSASEAVKFIDALLQSPSCMILSPTSRHPDVLRELVAEMPWLAGNLLHDVHTAVLMREHGVRRIFTRDSDFSRFPFVQVVDPLQIGSS